MKKERTWLQRLLGNKRQAAKPLDISAASQSLSAPIPTKQSSVRPRAKIFTEVRRIEYIPPVWKVGDLILGTYKVVGTLGEGGMGIVYHARDCTTGAMLAVKRPRQEIFRKPGSKEDFIREAETWVKLADHPNILDCYYVLIVGESRTFLQSMSMVGA